MCMYMSRPRFYNNPLLSTSACKKRSTILEDMSKPHHIVLASTQTSQGMLTTLHPSHPRPATSIVDFGFGQFQAPSPPVCGDRLLLSALAAATE